MERGAAIWVNGMPVSQQALHDQDEIAVGDRNTKMTLQLNRQATPTSDLMNGLQAGQNMGGTQSLGMPPVGTGR